MSGRQKDITEQMEEQKERECIAKPKTAIISWENPWSEAANSIKTDFPLMQRHLWH